MKVFSLNTGWKIGHLIFLFMVAMSIIYSMERVCYMDSAFMLFRMINSSSIIAEGGRWINILHQFLPWLFIQLNLPLNVVIICFSVMQIIVLYVFFILTGTYFNQKQTALIFVILLLVSVNETFFDAVTETKFSLASGILFIAFLNSDKRDRFLVGTLIIFCGFFSHPSFIIYFISSLLFTSVLKSDKTLLKYLIPGIVILLLKYAFIGSTVYESNLLEGAFSSMFTSFKNSFIHVYFGGLFHSQFLVFSGLFLIIIIYLITNKKYLLLILYFTMLLSSYFLLAILYSKGDSQMMIQKTMFLFHFIIVIPLICHWENRSIPLQKITMLLVYFGFILGIYGIVQAGDKFVNRIQILTEFMNKNKFRSDKYIIKESAMDHNVLMGTWALPHETILISNTTFKKSIVIKNFREKNDTLLYSRFPCAFRPAFGYPMMNKDLNSNYFRIDEDQPSIWLDSSFTLP